MDQEQLEQKKEKFEEESVVHENTDSLNAKVRDERGTKDHILIMVIALIVVALALAYLWGSGVGKRTAVEDVPDILPPMLPQEDVQATDVEQTSVSDEIESIEVDLLKVDIENLDIDLETLEAELQSALTE